jgi:hypothetical protein
MTSKPDQAAIDEIVASCNGDIRGALQALLLVNEQLETELRQLYAAVAHGAPIQRSRNLLH